MKMNMLIGNDFIPNPKEHLYIEVSNICNLRCRFCAYSKSLKNKKLIMSNEKFFSIINQATNFGYNTFGLTPIVGEVFVDKSFIDKLKFLENHPKVKNYSFFTNFTLANKQIIDELIETRKLRELYISLYGHDLNSFLIITKANKKTYNELITNLKYLLERIDNVNFTLSFGLRTIRSFKTLENCVSDLCRVVRDIILISKSDIKILKSFNTWGGMISMNDVKGIDMIINDPSKFYKKGACSLIFYKNQVMADGGVNACACRDINATLKIGDLNEQSFDEIYSIRNNEYIEIIESQQKGEFNPICTNCDFYRSIYKNYKVYNKYKKKQMGLKHIYNYLRKNKD
jgi:MoaA/NifB/PqqE/SkfB family radical SAM enzyme